MRKLLKSLSIFAAFCLLPFLGLLLTKIGYPEFKTTIDFAWGVGCCIFFGFVISMIYYFDDSNKTI